jgi:hypothetical protein
MRPLLAEATARPRGRMRTAHIGRRVFKLVAIDAVVARGSTLHQSLNEPLNGRRAVALLRWTVGWCHEIASVSGQTCLEIRLSNSGARPFHEQGMGFADGERLARKLRAALRVLVQPSCPRPGGAGG